MNIERRELKQAIASVASAVRSGDTRTATYYCIVSSPIGDLLLTGDGEHLTRLYMESHRTWPEKRPDWRWNEAPFKAAREQLRAYFAGELREFSLPLKVAASEFQQKVWDALIRIPYGVTVSYGEQARKIGQPNAARAVGLANGQNPISIIVPCHRVIGSNGALTGYGGGIERKRWLLRHEGVALKEDVGARQQRLI